MDDSMTSAMPSGPVETPACGPYSAAMAFCMAHSWEALRPWMGAALANDNHEPELLMRWLQHAPAHCRVQAQAALRALSAGPWELEHCPGDGRLTLRLHLSGDTSQVTALREALCGRVVGCLLQTQSTGPWQAAPESLPRTVGFEEAEALIDFDARSHSAYRLLTEYFAFPEKFNFIDLPWPKALQLSKARQVTLHFAMAGIRGESDEARLLETITARNLLTGCTPVVNLFSQRADPIRITHTSDRYPVLPDGRRAHGHEVYSIDKVFRVHQTAQGDDIQEFRPFFALHHDGLLAHGESAARYWVAHRDDTLAARSPGYETEISVVDINFDPAEIQTDTLSIEVKATNRDLPSQLTVGQAGGDLFLEGLRNAREVRMLRKPTLSHRLDRGRGALWRLISHLSLNHLTLSAGGLDALREMLRLYDLPRSDTNQRQLDGIVGISHHHVTACMPGQPFVTFVRGTEVRVKVNEQHFVGTGLRLFGQVLDHFFGLYVHANSFIQLKLYSERTQEELMSFPRRSGDGSLL
ncbi:MAG: type VI secretion system baseplate subunit TssF [Ideonella sp. MAG2]|nr:MAG: type VI secretion system baseplate subunit TssF [Ideonella sp. MAG2]